jgi:hypothetical protein
MFGIDDKWFCLFNYNENLFYPLHLFVLILQHGYNKVQNQSLLLNILFKFVQLLYPRLNFVIK